MKVGIFGDSYAHILERSTTTSWADLLSKDFDVENYAMGGSSTYFSYLNFLEHYQKYNKIIFVVTYPARMYTSFGHVPSAVTAKDMLTNRAVRLDKIQQKIIYGLDSYFTYSLLDNAILDQHILFHNLMIEKIKSLKKDILFIPAFSVPNTDFDRTALVDITRMEEGHWISLGYKIKSTEIFRYDNRQHHLTEPNNRILYQMVKDILPSVKNHVTLSLDLNNFSKPDDISKYLPNGK